MRHFAEVAEAIASTRSRLQKTRLLSEYFQRLTDPDLRAAAIFFTGRPFPLFDARTLNLGGAILSQAIQEISGATPQAMHDAYMESPDLGEVACKLLPQDSASTASPSEVFSVFETIVDTSGVAPKLNPISALLRRLTSLEAKYVVKIIT